MKIIKSHIFFALFTSLTCLANLTAEETASTLVSGTVMVDVGDCGNVGYVVDGGPFSRMKLGAVSYNYQIGKYEVTVGDWCCFLIATASQYDQNQLIDAHHLWNREMDPWITCAELSDGSHSYEIVKGKEKLPITHVSLLSAMRYCNWIEQGAPIVQPGEDVDVITEHGSYEFSSDGSVIENQDSHIYIPTQDEWVKAGYYAGGGRNVGYWRYPTQNNWSVPTFDSKNRTDSNMANYNGGWTGWCGSFWTHYSYNEQEKAPLTLTDVDFFNCSKSYYGCRDMGGNVNEWTTTLDASSNYIVRGGSYQSSYEDLMMIPARINSYPSETESPLIGFRIVAKNLDHDAIVSNQPHNSKSSVTVDQAAKKEQAQAERNELNDDLAGVILGLIGITLLILSTACFQDPTGNRVILFISLAGLTVVVACDIIRLLGLDFYRWMTK